VEIPNFFVVSNTRLSRNRPCTVPYAFDHNDDDNKIIVKGIVRIFLILVFLSSDKEIAASVENRGPADKNSINTDANRELNQKARVVDGSRIAAIIQSPIDNRAIG
jgi:hypothetical protein